MTKTLPNHVVRFYGHSDDLFEMEGAVCDEGEPGTFQIEDLAGQRLNLVSDFGQHGWMFGFAMVEEEDRWPNWSITLALAEGGGSPCVIMSLPEGTTITRIHPKPERCDECKRDRDPERWTVGK